MFPELTAQERAMHVMRSLRDGTEEDPKIRDTMPAEQIAEFNRYVGLINAANSQLGTLVVLVMTMVETLEARYAWLLSLMMWRLHTEQIALHLHGLLREPITKSAYRKALEAEQGKLLSRDDALLMLLDRDQDARGGMIADD
jgi:hypothetical protein